MISPFICGWLKIKFGLNKSLSSIDIIDITISFQSLGLCVLSLQSSLHRLKKHDCFEHKHNMYLERRYFGRTKGTFKPELMHHPVGFSAFGSPALVEHQGFPHPH